MKKRLTALVCAAVMLSAVCTVNADYKENEIRDALNSAIKWQEEYANPFYEIGSETANLYVIALKRVGKGYDYASYLAGLDAVAASYGAGSNVSDMHRTALAAVASGGDAGYIGGRDLITEATYNRSGLKNEGANGLSWALIALEASGTETPEGAVMTKNEIICSLLAHQNTDGSFDGDVYATASAVTALAPYYETSGSYTVTRVQNGDIYDLSPKNAIHAAVDYLADAQKSYGDFGDVRSTSMVVIALNSIGIDPDGDRRFSAQKGNALEGLMTYQKSDGGFSKSLRASDGQSTAYAICALVSTLRSQQGKTALFRLEVNDPAVLDTPKPAAPAAVPKTNQSSSSSAAKATTRPKTTVTPRSSAAPSVTMKPTKTAAPRQSGSPDVTPLPKATKRPALMGPPEMPGPMPDERYNSGEDIENIDDIEMKQESDKKSSAAAPTVVLIILIIAAAAAVAYIKLRHTLPEDNVLAKIFPFLRKKKREEYKAKKHRKTETHRRFDNHEKFREREKYKNRRKYK